MSEVHYLISDASRQVDVESHVLRYWEEELELDIPRNDMGHRYYTEYHIRLFRQIKELKEKGYQLKAIKNALNKMTGAMGEITITEDYMEEDMKAAWNEGPSREQPKVRPGELSRERPNPRTAQAPREQSKVRPAEILREQVKARTEASREQPRTRTAEASRVQLKAQTAESPRVQLKAQTAEASREQPETRVAESMRTQSRVRHGEVPKEPEKSRPAESPRGQSGTAQAKAVQEPSKVCGPREAQEQSVPRMSEDGTLPAPASGDSVRSPEVRGAENPGGVSGALSGEKGQGQPKEPDVRPAKSGAAVMSIEHLQRNLRKQEETSLKEVDNLHQKPQTAELNAEKMARFQSVMNHIIGRAMDANMDRLAREVSNTVSEDVTDKVMKEVEYLMRVSDEKEEERFRQLDETIRAYQKQGKGRAEAAAAKVPFFKKKKFGKSGKKLF